MFLLFCHESLLNPYGQKAISTKMMIHFHFQIGFVWGVVSLAAFLFSPFFGKYGSKIGPKLATIAGGMTQAGLELEQPSMATQLFMLMLAEQAIKAGLTHYMCPAFLACFKPFTQPSMCHYSHLIKYEQRVARVHQLYDLHKSLFLNI